MLAGFKRVIPTMWVGRTTGIELSRENDGARLNLFKCARNELYPTGRMLEHLKGSDGGEGGCSDLASNLPAKRSSQ